jgi:hypothetical protein
VEEALVEMYLAGVSVRRVEDITEALWGTRVSASTVSELNQKIYGRLDAWRNRPIDGSHPYVYLDGIWLKRCWGEEVRNVSVLVAIAAIVRRAKADLGIRAAIQVGDFGFESAIIQSWLDSSNAPFAVPVHAIDGNHEDHPWLREVRRTNADQLVGWHRLLRTLRQTGDPQDRPC